MKLYIKNMSSVPCKAIVKEELTKIGLHQVTVELGEVEIFGDISEAQIEQFKFSISRLGLDVIQHKKAMLSEKIKHLILDLIHHSVDPLNTNFSDYVSRILNYDYTYLNNIFVEVERTSIKKFVIAQKVERVQALLQENVLSLTQISNLMNYSSVGHLSNQFKKVTGLSPSQFKTQKKLHRDTLEKV